MPIYTKRNKHKLYKAKHTKRKHNKKANKLIGGGESQDNIIAFIKTMLTEERIVKGKTIKPVQWVFDLLSSNSFFTSIYIPSRRSSLI